MKIYISHSSSFDYKNELYIPLRESVLNSKYEIVLPHEESDEQSNSINFLQNSCNLMIAEVSYKSTGLGIELGRAELLKIPIICIYKKWTKVAWSVKVIKCNFIEYENLEDLICKLEKAILI